MSRTVVRISHFRLFHRYEESNGCSKCRVTEIRDPLNRKVTIGYGSGTGSDTITYRGYQGAVKTITVNHGLPYTTDCVRGPALYSAYNPTFLSSSSHPSLFGGVDTAFLEYCSSDLVPTSVVLGNGDTYSFQYNDYSELAQVILPTGGGYLYQHEGSIGGGSYVGTTIYRRLKNRKEFTVGTVTGYTSYAYDATAQSTTSSVTVTRKEGEMGAALGKVTYQFSGTPVPWAGTPVSYGYTDEGREKQIDYYYDADLATLLKQEWLTNAQRASVSWWTAMTPQERAGQQVNEPANDLRLTESTTMINPGSASQKNYRRAFEYDDYNNPTKTREYDFDGTTELRRTETTYLTTYASRNYDTTAGYSVPSTNTAEYFANAVATVYHIRNVPLQVSVYRGTCEVSRDVYDFDQTALTPRSSATQRLDAVASNFYPAGDPYGASMLARANVTKISKSIVYNQAAPSSQCVGSTTVSATRAYDMLGNVTSATDALSHATTFDYTDNFSGDVTNKGSLNTFAFVKTATNAKLQTITNVYDYNLGRVLSATDPNGQTTTYTYDGLGRLATAAFPDGGSAQKTYDASAGKITTQVTQAPHPPSVTEAYFDGLGRPCEARQNEASGFIRTFTDYDGAGRVKRTANPLRLTSASRCAAQGSEQFTTRQYDGLDRVTLVTAPDGSVNTTVLAGEKTTVTDPDGKTRVLWTDALGRLARVTEDPGGTKNFDTYYLYDALDDLAGVCPGSPFSGSTCSSARKRTFYYDSLKRLRRAENPESVSADYTYDDNGSLLTRADPRYTTTYSYDELNRMTGKSYSTGGGNPVTLCYDSAAACAGATVANGMGRLIHVSNGASKTRYNSFDQMGRVLSSTQTTPVAGVTPDPSYDFQYLYDAAGHLRWMKYPSGRELETRYDAAGRADKVSNKQGTTLTPYGEVGQFAAHGAIGTLKLGWSGTQELTTENWLYNIRLQPTETKLNPRGDTRNLVRLEYFYCPSLLASCTNNNGDLRSQRISYDVVGGETASWTGTQNYGYDPLNRLTTFSEGSANETNDYDAYGNRWAVQTGLTSDPLTPVTSAWFGGTDNRMVGVGYDGAGNQTQMNPYTLAYDAENHVVSAASASNGNAAYVYDGDGRRVKKTVNGTAVTVFVYDGSGQLAAEYGPADGTQGTQYQTGDHLGSVRVVTDAAGNVVRRHDYRPFGQDLSGVNGRSAKYLDTKNVPRFTGHLRDAESGLDYFGARYMSSAQGRFTSPDAYNPMMISQMSIAAGLPEEAVHSHMEDFLENPQNWNRYGYVRNNPLRFVDPFGQAPVDGHHLISARGNLTGLAAEFAESVKAGASGVGYPNQPGFNALHRAYNAAAEEILQTYEQSYGASRNAWTLSQWRQAAQGILNSPAPGIRNFLDLLNRNNAGKAIPALAAAISSFQPSAALIARTAGQSLLNIFSGPLVLIFDTRPYTDPVYREKKRKEKVDSTITYDGIE